MFSSSGLNGVKQSLCLANAMDLPVDIYQGLSSCEVTPIAVRAQMEVVMLL